MRRRLFLRTALATVAGLVLPLVGIASPRPNKGLNDIFRKGERNGFVHWTKIRMAELRKGDVFLFVDMHKQFSETYIADEDGRIAEDGNGSVVAHPVSDSWDKTDSHEIPTRQP